MIPVLKNNPHWGFVSGRISVLEGRLLPREFFLSLITLEHPEDLGPHMQDTLLRDSISPGVVWWGDFSELCDRFFYEMILSLREECPSTGPTDIFLLDGDYLNLKSALSGSSDFPFYFGLLSQEKLLMVSHGDYADLPSAFKESEAGVTGEAGEIDSTILDIVLDGAYLRNLLALAREIGSQLITTYTVEKVLAYIVIILWRALRMNQTIRRYPQYLLPLGDFNHTVVELCSLGNVENWPPIVGGSVGDMLSESLELREDDQIPAFELKVSNYLMRIVRDAKLQTAGPERVFGFLVGLQGEIQNLKLVVNGKLNRIDAAVLRQRLRDTYV